MEVGSIVRFSVPGSYETEGQARIVPAIVISQWPDGSLELFAFNFAGPYLIHAKPPGEVEVVMSRAEFDAIHRRLAQIEKVPREDSRFALADDPR